MTIYYIHDAVSLHYLLLKPYVIMVTYCMHMQLFLFSYIHARI